MCTVYSVLYITRFTTHIYKFPENAGWLAGCTVFWLIQTRVCFCLSFLSLSFALCERVDVCVRISTPQCTCMQATIHVCVYMWCFSFVGLLCTFLPLHRASSLIQSVQSSTNMHVSTIRSIFELYIYIFTLALLDAIAEYIFEPESVCVCVCVCVFVRICSLV